MSNLKNAFRSLLARGLTQAQCLEILGTHGDAATYSREVAEAREQCTDDLEIDDAPMVSSSDDGVWISAWIYVRTDSDEAPADHVD